MTPDAPGGPAPAPRVLARRIERAQAAQMERSARAAPGASVLEVAGGLAVSFGPSSPFSAAVAIGLDGLVTAADLERIEAHLGAGGGDVHVEVVAHADPSLPELLGERGYALERFHLVWWRAPLPLPSAPAADVRPIAPGEEDLFLDAFGDAFLGAPPRGAVRDGFRAMARAEGNACFLAREGGAPAGVAIASCEGGVAQLTGAGVVPGRRGRGLQAALVRARLAWAAERGCDLAASSTDPATASQRTLERAGFRCAYPKAVMVRRGAGRR
jgi:GNAT superfamily N-acetyltransferase